MEECQQHGYYFEQHQQKLCCDPFYQNLLKENKKHEIYIVHNEKATTIAIDCHLHKETTYYLDNSQNRAFLEQNCNKKDICTFCKQKTILFNTIKLNSIKWEFSTARETIYINNPLPDNNIIIHNVNNNDNSQQKDDDDDDDNHDDDFLTRSANINMINALTDFINIILKYKLTKAEFSIDTLSLKVYTEDMEDTEKKLKLDTTDNILHYINENTHKHILNHLSKKYNDIICLVRQTTNNTATLSYYKIDNTDHHFQIISIYTLHKDHTYEVFNKTYATICKDHNTLELFNENILTFKQWGCTNKSKIQKKVTIPKCIFKRFKENRCDNTNIRIITVDETVDETQIKVMKHGNILYRLFKNTEKIKVKCYQCKHTNEYNWRYFQRVTDGVYKCKCNLIQENHENISISTTNLNVNVKCHTHNKSIYLPITNSSNILDAYHSDKMQLCKTCFQIQTIINICTQNKIIVELENDSIKKEPHNNINKRTILRQLNRDEYSKNIEKIYIFLIMTTHIQQEPHSNIVDRIINELNNNENKFVSIITHKIKNIKVYFDMTVLKNDNIIYKINRQVEKKIEINHVQRNISTQYNESVFIQNLIKCIKTDFKPSILDVLNTEIQNEKKLQYKINNDYIELYIKKNNEILTKIDNEQDAINIITIYKYMQNYDINITDTNTLISKINKNTGNITVVNATKHTQQTQQTQQNHVQTIMDYIQNSNIYIPLLIVDCHYIKISIYNNIGRKIFFMSLDKGNGTKSITINCTDCKGISKKRYDNFITEIERNENRILLTLCKTCYNQNRTNLNVIGTNEIFKTLYTKLKNEYRLIATNIGSGFEDLFALSFYRGKKQQFKISTGYKLVKDKYGNKNYTSLNDSLKEKYLCFSKNKIQRKIFKDEGNLIQSKEAEQKALKEFKTSKNKEEARLKLKKAKDDVQTAIKESNKSFINKIIHFIDENIANNDVDKNKRKAIENTMCTKKIRKVHK